MLSPVTGAGVVVVCAKTGSAKAAKAALIKVSRNACFMVCLPVCVFLLLAALAAQGKETRIVKKCCEFSMLRGMNDLRPKCRVQCGVLRETLERAPARDRPRCASAGQGNHAGRRR